MVTVTVLAHAAAAAAAAAGAADAPTALALKSPAIASSAVLQRDVPLPIIGVAPPGSTITVMWLGAVHTGITSTMGRWQVNLPPHPAMTAPATMRINATVTVHSGDTRDDVVTQSIELGDLVVGDVFVCSGQSNMVRPLSTTAFWREHLTEAPQYAPLLRVTRVQETADNVTAPKHNYTALLPWQRVSQTSAAFYTQFSAVCYYRGVEAVRARPNVPVGLIESAWGGTPIQVWMDPASLASCGVNETHADVAVDSSSSQWAAVLPGGGTGGRQGGAADSAVSSVMTPTANPTTPTILYNNMIAPLLSTPVAAFNWYQGEANSNAAALYACLFPAMIRQWRQAWQSASGGGMGPATPFSFVQLSAWPKQDDGTLPDTRYAQTAALSLPNVSMAVAADVADPSGPFHPVHPVWKSEVGRRLHLSQEATLFGNTSVPHVGPRVVSVKAFTWNASWGAFHDGTGANQTICPRPAGTPSPCMGLQVTFDQRVRVRPSYGMQYGFANGFRLWQATRQYFQPVTLTGVSVVDPHVVQLNATWISPGGAPAYLTYAWADYPTMLIEDAVYARPAPPFNVTFTL